MYKRQHLLGVPAVLTVPFADEQAALAQCYAAAGPARCREALMQVLALPEDTRYLAFSPDVLERIASRYGPVRIGFSGALTEDELARYGRNRAVQGISAGDAHAFLCQLQADTALSPQRTAAARAAAWDAFFLSLIHISEPTRRTPISYAVFCLKKKKNHETESYPVCRLLLAKKKYKKHINNQTSSENN